MNWESFGIIGYLGLALALGAVLSWLAYWAMKKRILCRIGLGLAVGAMACATINSVAHVNRIRIDPSSQLAEMEARQEAQRQAVLDSRGDEVAQIRFAEDGGDEFLDKAGMDEADLKYMERITESGEPAWKKDKKSRSGGGRDDDSLESLIDDEEQEGGADVADLEEEAGPDPILMTEADVMMANRLDHWNLRLSRYLLLIAVVMLALDYLRRVNIYRESTIPLPLPSAWPNAVTPIPAVVERPDPPRRKIPEELAWLARRGDSFVYLTDNSLQAGDIITELEPLKNRRRPLELLRVTDDEDRFDDDFVFEALWFGRSSFVVDSAERAEQMWQRFLELLKERRATRARTSQTVHIVWDLEAPVPETLRQAITDFAGPAGFSLLVCRAAAA